MGLEELFYQDLVKISKAIEDKSVEENPVLVDAFEYAQNETKNIHFLGLAFRWGSSRSFGSFGRPFGHDKKNITAQEYLFMVLPMDEMLTPNRGWATSKNYCLNWMTLVENWLHLQDDTSLWIGIKDGSGLRKLMTLLFTVRVTLTQNLVTSIKDSYESGVTDEFIEPLICH